MMIASEAPTGHSIRFTQSDLLFVLEPLRHLGLPSSFLSVGSHSIGSSDLCAIRLIAEGVQPCHALFVVGQRTILLKAIDLKTWVNDDLVAEAVLRPGDRVTVGPITLIVRIASSDEIQSYIASQLPGDVVASGEPSTPFDTTKSMPVAFVEDYFSTSFDPAFADDQRVADTAEFEIRNAVEHPVVSEAMSFVDLKELEPRICEIEQQIEALAEQTRPLDVVRDKSLAADRNQRLADRQSDLDRLAADLSRQSQELMDRAARANVRDLELDEKQSRLAAENERFVAMSETVRQNLAKEYSRQKELWQEWDAACHRTSTEINRQLQAVENRRIELRDESDRSVIARAEIQKLRDDSRKERQASLVERQQIDAEKASLQTMRAAFETDRQEQLIAIQKREALLASERCALTNAQAELHAFQRQIESDRTDLANDRASESARREKEVLEHALLRSQLDDERVSQRESQSRLDLARRDLDAQLEAVNRGREELLADQTHVADLQSRLQNAEYELTQLQQALDLARLDAERERNERHVAISDDMHRQREELEELSRGLERRQSAIEETRATLQAEREELQESRAQLDQSVEDLQQKQVFFKSDRFDSSDRSEHDASIASYSDVSELVNVPHQVVAETPPELSSLPFESFSPVPPPIPTSEHVTESNADFVFESVVESVPETFVETFPESVIESVAETGVESEPAPADALGDLRARLAKMFDLGDGQIAATPSVESDPESPSSPDVERSEQSVEQQHCLTGSASEIDEICDGLNRLNGEVASESALAQEDGNSSDGSAEFSLADSNAGESKKEPEPEVADAEEDAWTRRLRELSAVANAAEASRAPAPVVPASVAIKEQSGESSETDEFSIEAQLARLLGKPLTSSGEARPASHPASSRTTTNDERDEAPNPSLATHSEPVDRSHLAAEPTHRQNKDSAREEMKSFRAVAQSSARSALARHSSKGLRSSMNFAAGLSVVSAAAAAWFVSSWLTNQGTPIWYGIACSVAAIVSIGQLARICSQMRKKPTSAENADS